MHPRPICAPVALFTIALLAVQSATGCVWSRERREVIEKISVSTTPAGAHIWRKDALGRQSVGQAPRTVERRYKVTTARYNRWQTLLGLLISGGATVGGFAGYGALDSGETGGRATLLTGGILAASVAFGYLVGAIAGEVNPKQERFTPAPLRIGASATGHLDAWYDLKTPHGKEPVKLALSPGGAPSAPIPPTAKPAPSPAGAVVAVFDIQDASKRIKAGVLDQLTEYLAAQLTAQAAMQVVPRRQLRERLSQQKREGFKACYDTACQIELGKAVAAQRSLSTKLLRVGGRCALTSVLYDLKRETSIKAASVDTGCSLEALMDGVRQVSEKLK